VVNILYKIAICDDDKDFVRLLREQVSDVLNHAGVDFNISAFFSGEELLHHIDEKSAEFDLYLLDIYMKEINGMDAAKAIRRKSRDAAIIFTTSSEQHVLSGYEVQALQYLMKPIDPLKLSAAMTTDMKRRFENRNYVFKTGGMTQKVAYEEIEYFESALKSVRLKTNNGVYEIYTKISDVESSLPALSFCRCHRGFIVNFKHVLKMNAQSLITTSGAEIPIGKTYAASTNRAFLNYIGGNDNA
jgi:DNA-binding LytR/AlgR family response regulator